MSDIQLVEPIHYTVLPMHVTAVDNKPGLIVDVIASEWLAPKGRPVLMACDPNHPAREEYMGHNGSVIGRGVLVEKISVDTWFVAYRPWTPMPKRDYTGWEK